MSAATEHEVYRHAVVYCVVPSDLKSHYEELRRHLNSIPDVQVVVERRASGPSDRRGRGGQAPGGEDRRAGDRRQNVPEATLADLGVYLPWALRRYAERIACVTRLVPVHMSDGAREADELLRSAAAGDLNAQQEMRLRYHQQVQGVLRASESVGRRRATEMTHIVFDELFAQEPQGSFPAELSRACERALSR